MPHHTRAVEILDRWREAERRYEAARPDEVAALLAEIDQLRAEFHAIVLAPQRPEPEPPPSAYPLGGD